MVKIILFLFTDKKILIKWNHFRKESHLIPLQFSLIRVINIQTKYYSSYPEIVLVITEASGVFIPPAWQDRLEPFMLVVFPHVYCPVCTCCRDVATFRSFFLSQIRRDNAKLTNLEQIIRNTCKITSQLWLSIGSVLCIPTGGTQNARNLGLGYRKH